MFTQALAIENCWASLKRMASEQVYTSVHCSAPLLLRSPTCAVVQAIDDFRLLIERDAEVHQRTSHAPEESPWQFARQILKFTRNELVAADLPLLSIAPPSVNSEDTFAGMLYNTCYIILADMHTSTYSRKLVHWSANCLQLV